MKRLFIPVLALCIAVLSRQPAYPGDDFVLPPVMEDPSRLSSVGKVHVERFELDGNSVFSDDELKSVVSSYEKREITAEELQDVKNHLTKYYIDRGYVNSGAVIPDQGVEKGVILIKIIEGRLVKTEITGNTWLREGYVKKRLDLAAGEDEPLNIVKLQERLKIIKQDPRIDNVNAELRPGLQPGEAELGVEIDEAKPYQVTLEANNHNSPSIGPYRGEISARHINLTGWGDSLSASYGLTEGLDSFSADYTVPFTRWDTTFSVGVDRSESTVVANPFDQLDIESETTTYYASLRHPFYKTVSKEFTMGLKFEKREGKTSLLGEPFDFSEGSENGESEISVLRFSQEWLDRTLSHVIAARSTFNFGLDALDATIHEHEPDGKFFSWLGQFQYLRRVGERGNQVLFRADYRYSDDPMLPMEKFAVGGSSTVRGYRENQMTTDNGVVASLELRIPIAKLKIPGLSKGPNDGQLRVAPFLDYGRGWNAEGEDPDPEDIYSIGVGALWAVNQKINVAVYWGYALEDVEVSSEYDIQDDGVHFRMSVDLF